MLYSELLLVRDAALTNARDRQIHLRTVLVYVFDTESCVCFMQQKIRICATDIENPFSVDYYRIDLILTHISQSVKWNTELGMTFYLTSQVFCGD